MTMTAMSIGNLRKEAFLFLPVFRSSDLNESTHAKRREKASLTALSIVTKVRRQRLFTKLPDLDESTLSKKKDVVQSVEDAFVCLSPCRASRRASF